MNKFDIYRDYGPANWDVPHRLVVSYVWDMPFFVDSDNVLLHGMLRRLADRWRHDDPERHAAQRHHRARPRQRRAA